MGDTKRLGASFVAFSVPALCLFALAEPASAAPLQQLCYTATGQPAVCVPVTPDTPLPVTIPAGSSATVAPTDAPSTDISGTVTLGGTYQIVAAANATRKNCTVQNPSTATEALLVKFGTQAQPYALGAGQAIAALNGVVTATDAITVTATTNGHVFSGTCQ